MITKKELTTIFYLNKELQMWVRKKCEVEYGIKSPTIDVEAVSKSRGNGAEKLVLLRLEISEQIDKILGTIQEERMKIYRALSKINDSRLRQVITYRCLDLCTWQQVANNMAGNETADSARVYFNRAFSKDGTIKKEFIKE